MFNILVVEDDVNTNKLITTILNQENYKVFNAYDGIEALDVMDKEYVDLIVLDVMMPNMDGYTFTETLRECKNYTPILMLTAKQLPEEKCQGFLVGTDDYMVKPFNHDELLLRIKALLRRSQITNERKIRIGDIVLDYDSLTLSRGNESQTLPQKEFYLLYKLLSYPNKIFTRIQLMDEIWGMDSESGDKTINVHINRLRTRLKDYPEIELKAIRGIGYKAIIHEKKNS